jgi:thiosulfate dehydrogenase
MVVVFRKFVAIASVTAVSVVFYIAANAKHQERADIRQAEVVLTPGCEKKLTEYGLIAAKSYVSPYASTRAGYAVIKNGYSREDVLAIKRGCNVIDDLQGQDAADITHDRWDSTRYVRGTHTSCDHCHQGIGDKQDQKGNRLVGSLSIPASWMMADSYDRFTGLLLPYELRQMQCFINSSNGYKPNIADDLIRDVTMYTRFLAAALDLKYGIRYPEQGIDEVPVSATQKQGDDYVRGKAIFLERCAKCHGEQGLGTVIDGRVIYPAVAGPNSFNLQSRNNFAFVSTILPGFICRNMPLGEEGTLTNQQCRDIAFYISNLPRPAGDIQGPVAAAAQQVMMKAMPPLVKFSESRFSSADAQQVN